MAETSIYSTLRWRVVRLQALDRDRHTCAVKRFLGPEFGTCSGVLSVHHLKPVDENGAPYELSNLVTLCSGHHHRIHGIRRYLLEKDGAAVPRCGHYHRTEEGRRICEMRMARRRVLA